MAALGVMLTHTAFQTRTESAILARFDYFVAVFFALSAFLLWRGLLGRYAPEAHRNGGRASRSSGRVRAGRQEPQPPRFGRAEALNYLERRCRRILPAALVCMAVTFAFVPAAFATPWPVILANLGFLQIYFPDALAGGLTHLWSLSVEVAFYAALPLGFVLVGHRPQRVRVASMLALVLGGVAWALVPWPAPGVNFQIYPPTYLPWFVVGLLAAEYEGMLARSWMATCKRGQWVVFRAGCWAAALFLAWMAGQAWYGPLGLTHPTPGELVRRILAGALFAAVLVVPLTCHGSRLLEHPVAQTLGRWSYSVFLWHLPVLSVVFSLFGIPAFGGHMVLVSALTFGITLAVARMSYEYVELPLRRRVLRR